MYINMLEKTKTSKQNTHFFDCSHVIKAISLTTDELTGRVMRSFNNIDIVYLQVTWHSTSCCCHVVVSTCYSIEVRT